MNIEKEKIYRVEKSKSNLYIITENNEPLKDANKYLRILETRGLSPLTSRAYGYDIIYILRWLNKADKHFFELTQSDLIEFMAFQKDQQAKPRSINRRLTTCESFFKYCFDKPIISSSNVNYPAAHYRGAGRDRALGLYTFDKPSRLRLSVKVPQTLIKTLSVEDVDTFLQGVTRYRDLSIVFLMLMCGLRSCEVLNLVIDGVDFVNSQIKILGKGNKERVIPFPKQLSRVIQKYLQFERPINCNHQKVFVALQGKRRSEPMTKEGLRNFFRYRRAKSGVHDAKPHRWRHTFGTEMARAGVSYESLQKMMGHSPGSPITSQYIHLSMADIANEYNQAIKRIEQNYEIKRVSK